MATADAALRRLDKSAQRVRAAEDDLAQARAELRKSLAAAYDAGASVSEIARRLGVSRTRVYTMLEQRE